MSIERYKEVWEEFRAKMDDLERRRADLFARILGLLDEQRIAALRDSLQHDRDESK